MKKINPYEITFEDFPVFVFSDDMRGFLSWGIKAHTSGSYSHGMVMIRPDKVVTQGMTYKEIDIGIYLTGRHRLKFWKYNGLSKPKKIEIITKIEDDLSQPWWKRRYDFLGIVGQFIKVPWINNPWINFCTERLSGYLRMIPEIKDKIPKHPSPADLNKLFKTIENMEVIGRFYGD